jgi:PilZ domain
MNARLDECQSLAGHRLSGDDVDIAGLAPYSSSIRSHIKPARAPTSAGFRKRQSCLQPFLKAEEYVMASAWETISNNRRREPRYRVSLVASVSLIGKETEDARWTTVLARTRDISREGLCLIMPSAVLGSHNLNEGEHVMRVVLGLPNGDGIMLEGRLVYCRPFHAGGFGGEYLAGINFAGIGPVARAAYDDFLDGLGRK